MAAAAGRRVVATRHAAAAVFAALLAACTAAPPPAEPAAGPVARHPIQPAATLTRPEPALPSADEPRRLTPGPNARTSPSPDLAPRVERTPRGSAPSSRGDVDELSRQLQQQREWKPEKPGPPVGTIDLRPGTIRTTPGTIEVPR